MADAHARRAGPLVLRCAMPGCERWRAKDLKTAHNHRRQVHGIEVKTTQRGGRTRTKVIKPKLPPAPEVCETCGKKHRIGNGSHERWLAWKANVRRKPVAA